MIKLTNNYGAKHATRERAQRIRAARVSFMAVCDRCYTCVIATGSKRECERAATSHGNAYGHHVHISAPLPVPVSEA